MSLTTDEAASAIRAYDDTFVELLSLNQWKTTSLSAKTFTATYTTSSANTTQPKSLIILIASSQFLDAQSSLFETISSQSVIPLPSSFKRDDSGTIISSPYVLYAHPSGVPLSSLSTSPSQAELQPQEKEDHVVPDTVRTRAAAELRLGTYLHALHELQNDWFGLPYDKKEWEECYSWQEAFTLLLETALGEVEELVSKRHEQCSTGNIDKAEDHVDGVEVLPIPDLRRYLGRAIGFYLFDDVEVPCLIWCIEKEWGERIFINARAPNEGEIVGIIGWEGAIWGDPLLEGVFHSPSSALLEGYGGSPIVFARQHTKRMWYTTYVALRALLAAASIGETKREMEARETIKEMAKKLKDAPCY